jgi:hypothetical protein
VTAAQHLLLLLLLLLLLPPLHHPPANRSFVVQAAIALTHSCKSPTFQQQEQHSW